MRYKLDMYINAFKKNFKFLGNLIFILYGLLGILFIILAIWSYIFLTWMLGIIVGIFIFPKNDSMFTDFMIGFVSEILSIFMFYVKYKVKPKLKLIHKELDTLEISEKNLGSFYFSYKTISGNYENIKTDCSNFSELLDEIKIFMSSEGYSELDIKIYNKKEEIGYSKIEYCISEKDFIKNIKYVIDEENEIRESYYT